MCHSLSPYVSNLYHKGDTGGVVCPPKLLITMFAGDLTTREFSKLTPCFLDLTRGPLQTKRNANVIGGTKCRRWTNAHLIIFLNLAVLPVHRYIRFTSTKSSRTAVTPCSASWTQLLMGGGHKSSEQCHAWCFVYVVNHLCAAFASQLSHPQIPSIHCRYRSNKHVRFSIAKNELER